MSEFLMDRATSWMSHPICAGPCANSVPSRIYQALHEQQRGLGFVAREIANHRQRWLTPERMRRELADLEFRIQAAHDRKR